MTAVDQPTTLLLTRRRRALPTVPTATVRPDDDVPGVLTRLWADGPRGLPTVHVLQLTAPSTCDLAIELVLAAELTGDLVGYEDATPHALAPEPDAVSGRFPPLPVTGVPGTTIVGLRRPRVDGAAVRVLRTAEVAVLAVDRGVRPAVLRDATAKLRGLDVGVRGLIRFEGRVPTDPSRLLPTRSTR